MTPRVTSIFTSSYVVPSYSFRERVPQEYVHCFGASENAKARFTRTGGDENAAQTDPIAGRDACVLFSMIICFPCPRMSGRCTTEQPDSLGGSRISVPEALGAGERRALIRSLPGVRLE